MSQNLKAFEDSAERYMVNEAIKMLEDLTKNSKRLNHGSKLYLDREAKKVLDAGTSLYYSNGKHERMIAEKKARNLFIITIAAYIAVYASIIGIIGYIVVHFIRKIW